jgi:hypothetical protein
MTNSTANKWHNWIINRSKPLLSLATLFMDISVEYSWAQITMKHVMSELLGVIVFALSVLASVSLHMSSSGHCINAILFSHIALGILCLFSKNVKVEGGYWDQRMRWISRRKCWLNTGMHVSWHWVKIVILQDYCCSRHHLPTFQTY